MAQGDLYKRFRALDTDLQTVAENRGLGEDWRTLLIPVNDFATQSLMVELRGDYASHTPPLNPEVFPAKADLIVRYDLSADEEADLDAIMAIYKTAADKKHWVSVFVNSLPLIQNHIEYQTPGEWQSLLNEATLYTGVA